MSPIRKVILNKETDIKPIWIMRQAGRYLPEFRDIRKKNSDFIKLCLNNCIEKTVIKHLVDEGFKITIDDIRTCLDMEDIVLVEHLSKKFNSI